MPPVTIQRAILTGAALGLYFGWFFRPSSREPSATLPIFLGIVITLVLTVIRLIRRQREQLLQQMPVTLISTILFLYVLEARHIALDIGGRPLVLAMMAFCGGLSGYFYGKRAL